MGESKSPQLMDDILCIDFNSSARKLLSYHSTNMAGKEIWVKKSPLTTKTGEMSQC